MVIGSMRHEQATLKPDEFLKEALGTTEAGRYYGGGRRGAGGFEIPIGFLAAIRDDDLVRMKWRLYDELIKKKLFAKIGVHAHPPVIRAEGTRTETGQLRQDESTANRNRCARRAAKRLPLLVKITLCKRRCPRLSYERRILCLPAPAQQRPFCLRYPAAQQRQSRSR